MPGRSPVVNRAAGAIGSIALSHVFFPLLIIALLFAPPSSPHDHSILKQTQVQWLISAKPILRILLGLSVVRSLNRALSVWAMNNWRVTAHEGWDWDNEVAVVTGGSGDIGRALVSGLIARGVRVAVLDMEDPPPALKDNAKVLFVRCNVSSPDEIARAGEEIRQIFGHPSILINNAGVIRTTTILDETEEHLRNIVGVNLMAHWFTAKVFLPHMLTQNKGHVITMASLAAYIALPTSVDYSATKAGALSFHEGLACEIKHLYKAPGVMTTLVQPDFVKTKMTKAYWAEVEAAGGLLLTVDEVVQPALQQIFSRRGGHLIIPKSRAVVSLLRGWPTWLQEIVRDFIGKADRAALDSPWVKN
ncbi:NAD(P)-binding protein [Xylariaceae sp. FL1272]|nr:NAD(P)-binding protein [Xylariaceae sp. FL1272]